MSILCHKHKSLVQCAARPPWSRRPATRRLAYAALCALVLSPLATVARAAAVDDSIEKYRPYMMKEIAQALAGARALQRCVAAHDLTGAKKAWIAARVGWERAEVFTSGFVPDLDEQIDAWPNALTGFHAIEAKLFGANSTAIARQVRVLVYFLADLDIKVRRIPLNAQGLLNGAARLAYEVGESKADGGESRYSGTSLDDMRNNVAGIALAYKVLFATTLESADPKIAADVRRSIDQLQSLVANDLETTEPEKVRASSEELVLALQSAAPKLGLQTPSLEVLAQ